MKEIKVLLVDDEFEFVTTLAERLRLRKIQTKIATDGETALSMLNDFQPDFVILDLKMPGLSGLEVLKQLKSLKKDLPVMLLTGHGSTKEGIEGMNLGAIDFMVKPVNIDELVNKMMEATNDE